MKRKSLFIIFALVLIGVLLAWIGVQPVKAPSGVATFSLTSNARPLIIDTDMAADDWMAITYLLQRQDQDVLAITVTGTGEAHCTPGVKNAMALTALTGRSQIPVACGRETPLAGTHVFPQGWRDGVDRMLGISLAANPNPPSDKTAVQLLTELLKNSPEKVTLVTLGPLTNVGEALEADASLASRIQMIYIMGGAFDVTGNVSVGPGGASLPAEWNIYVDPRSLALVLKSGAPVTFVPLDATNQVPITQAFYDRVTAAKDLTPAASFVYQVLEKQHGFISSGGYYFWDPLTAVISTQEDLAKIEPRTVAVVEEESDQIGKTVSGAEGNPARIAVSADQARFETLFLETLTGKTQ